MTTLRATLAPTVTAAVDTGGRTITGMVIPYDVVGSTSLGPLTVKAGAVRLPEDLSRVKLFLDHDRTMPVGWAIAAHDGPDGLLMSFKIGEGETGDRVLSEASPSSPLRDGLSVELDGITFTDDSETVVADSFLRGVAVVPVPAFDDARVQSVAASHNHGGTVADTPKGTPMQDNPTATVDASTDAGTSQPAPSTPSPAAPAPSPASAPAGLVAAAAPARRSFDHPSEFYAAMVSRHTQSATPELLAALSDITQGAASEANAPQFVGELWDGVRYERRVVPLLGSGTLTSYTVNGWRWVVKPAVAAYTGDKAAVPSNAATTAAVTEDAERLAGAHDIDRKFRDFNDTAFFQSYYEAMTESYARLSDAAAVDALEAGATLVNNAHVSDGLFGAIATGIAAIDTATNAASTFVLVNKADLISALLPLTNMDVPAYLDLLGIDPSRIVAHPSMTAGKTLVGTREAATFYELPGSPIRVEAVDMVKGGIDAGVFGYYAVLINDADGLQLVDNDAA